MKDQKDRRTEERKFKRVFLRFGLEAPKHRATGVQISSRGLFIYTIHFIYPPGSKVIVEVSTPKARYTVPAVVRHAKKMPALLINNERCGMGVNFISPPKELLDYLASL